jgi:hypothetical protein
LVPATARDSDWVGGSDLAAASDLASASDFLGDAVEDRLANGEMVVEGGAISSCRAFGASFFHQAIFHFEFEPSCVAVQPEPETETASKPANIQR